MDELTTQPAQLPTTIGDLSKFVLVGREKLTSVRAEIRAIDKLQLAQEVRDQKRDEARMLSEALLDAEVRLGELFKQIPKSPGGRPSSKTTDTAVDSFANQSPSEMVIGTSVVNQKPKAQVITELGFSQKQAERFETLASHPDLVAQVKAEARENDDLPTRTAVLNLAKYKEEKCASEYRQIDEDGRLAQQFAKALGAVNQLPKDGASIAAVCRGSAIIPKDDNIGAIKNAVNTLLLIKRGFEGR